MAEAEARYVQGDLLVRNGSIDEAAEELGAALVLDPSHVGARIDSAQILRERGNPGAAIDALKAIAAEAPTNFAAAYYLAAALASEWRHDEAIAAYSRAVELNAGSADAWMGLSVTALALGRTVQANAAMTQAMRREGGSDMYRSRAYAALAVGADAIAAADTRRYLELAGWSTETAVYTAFVGAIGHLRLQQVDQARELLSTAREVSSSAPWTMLVADFLDDRVTPVAFLAKAKSDGEKTEAHAYIGFRAEIDGRKDEAITHFQWVTDNGAKNYYEYRMARSALKRLQR